MGFQELLDPHRNKRRRFDKIIDLVAKAQRPKTNYRFLSHVDLLGLDFLRRILEIQTSYMLLLRSFAAIYSMKFVTKDSTARFLPEPIAARGELSLEEIMNWSRRVETKELYETFCSYPHRGLISLFADLKLEEPFLHDEFAARVIDKPFTAEMILSDWGGLDRVKEVEKLLRVNKIKSFRPEKQSDDDIRQSAWEKTLCLWRQPESALWRPGAVNDEVLTPMAIFPGAPYIQMLPPEKEFWEGPMARAWHDGKLAFLREGVPILAGEKESIPEKARQDRRNEWERIARQKAILDDPAVQMETRRLIHERTDSAPDVSSRMLDVLRIAKKRWGAKAVKALRHNSEGRTEEEAAKLAGITSRTLRNYKLKLTKDFSKKK